MKLSGYTFCLLFLVLQNLPAQTALPAGFAQILATEGLNPTCMAYAPGGSIFLAQKDGRVLLFHDGVLHSQPFLTLQVDDYNEKGLNGIAIDPDFENNPWVYLYYTVKGAQHNRISRVMANGDFAVPGSEQVLMDLDPLSGSIHNAGSMVFGPDNMLYIGVGDGAKSDNAQNLNTVLGKILRLETDGSIPADNPFFSLLSGNNRAIYAYGVRNPFSMACDPATGKIYFCDVGAEAWEEVNELTPGANYGWKLYQGASGNPAFTDPKYAYNHSEGCAIVGAAFAFHDNDLIPEQYRGKFFFADYCQGWIRMLDPATGTLSGPFATGIDRPVSLLPAPDGALYYLARAGLGGGSETDNTASTEGTLWRVFWAGEGPPLFTAHPQSVLVAEGESATFQAQAFGTQPITYQWYRNGAAVPGADGPLLLLDNLSLADSGGLVYCIAENSFGADTSETALTGVSSNKRPVPEILLPLTDMKYRGGDTLHFSGQASDPEEGLLPAGRLSWRIDLHHGTHAHPALPYTPGTASGAFVVPVVGETSTDVFFRIYLTARDTQGFEKTVWRDVQPVKTDVSVAGPAGIALNVDGQIRPLPASFESVVGMVRTIQAPEIQQLGNTVYLFDHWNDGSTGPLITFATPETPVEMEAFFNSYTLGAGTGLLGQYFIDPDGDLDEPPVLTRMDTTINFNWGDGSPDMSVPANYFTARWTGFVEPLFSETYTFTVFSDDGCRLWVNDSLIIDKWQPQPPMNNAGSITLEAGKKYRFRLEFLEIGGGALVQLSWSSAHQVQQIVPKRQLYPPQNIFSGSIEGSAGIDGNNNGFWEQGEPTFTGATVRLYDAVTDSLLASTTTVANGYYLFADLPPGIYYLRVSLPPTSDVFTPVQNVDGDGLTPTLVLTDGEHKKLDVAWTVLSIALGGDVWLDENADDLQGVTEPLLGDITVLLYRADTTLVGAKMTASDGRYGFSLVSPGQYFLVFLHSFSAIPVHPGYGLDAEGQTAVFNMVQGQYEEIDVAFVPDNVVSTTSGQHNGGLSFLKLYPNPAGETLRAVWSGYTQTDTQWRIFDATGRAALAGSAPAAATGGIWELRVESLPPGMYYLLLENESGRSGQRFVKQ